jgi:hypothetical protein
MLFITCEYSGNISVGFHKKRSTRPTRLDQLMGSRMLPAYSFLKFFLPLDSPLFPGRFKLLVLFFENLCVPSVQFAARAI